LINYLLLLKLIIIQKFSYSILRLYKLDTSLISILKCWTRIRDSNWNINVS